MQNFDQIAEKIFEEIISKVEAQDKDFLVDINYSNQVLTIEANAKVFVINKQTPKFEIWLSSPLSGPHHFKLKGDSWQNTRGEVLHNILSLELSELIGKTIKL
ncbi:MAG: iron donor protein CyaY [Rickettsiaceae bacterium]|nr:iron donor protein CyaY [Rickettsiaceae bacterium]